jgi:DNA-binding MarR family transcriptional regulator
MDGSSGSRHVLIALVDEVLRLGVRLSGAFAAAKRDVGIGDSEFLVLNAVVEAERPPTVPRIGRSLGRPRQLVQRAADSLEAAGFIRTVPNPDHKRAVLLVAEKKGIAIKRRVDTYADRIAESLGADVDLEKAQATANALRLLRKQLEARLRAENT